MKKITVIGGGTLGLDIAQVFARSGFEVVVRDITEEIIKASESRLNKSLDKLIAKGKLGVVEAARLFVAGHRVGTGEMQHTARRGTSARHHAVRQLQERCGEGR